MSTLRDCRRLCLGAACVALIALGDRGLAQKGRTFERSTRPSSPSSSRQTPSAPARSSPAPVQRMAPASPARPSSPVTRAVPSAPSFRAPAAGAPAPVVRSNPFRETNIGRIAQSARSSIQSRSQGLSGSAPGRVLPQSSRADTGSNPGRSSPQVSRGVQRQTPSIQGETRSSS
ncbi:MAG: hypothetical protein KBE04_12595, partial [Phycisphaerae bacterium]|nr:hypothetical protein [Phycisphaerae bacterium]